MASKAAVIASLNDTFRKNLNSPSNRGDRIMLTRGLNDLGFEFVQEALKAVMQFDAFSEDNDPHGEHDFGSFECQGVRCFFKLDYYDKSCEYGSDDPADPTKTTRVLTIALMDEY